MYGKYDSAAYAKARFTGVFDVGILAGMSDYQYVVTNQFTHPFANVISEVLARRRKEKTLNEKGRPPPIW